ncbi:hypothetical protein CEXT_244231 [Caerostris extrusa]|uniref:Uncharacterized protein n=1 Tax=Caerostris extrusa TaxID=172846 RepID=A0AAV4X5V2_CAEEX|nr:hypothetical protein CEXT_244231 [Caerostris extrusa]
MSSGRFFFYVVIVLRFWEEEDLWNYGYSGTDGGVDKILLSWTPGVVGGIETSLGQREAVGSVPGVVAPCPRQLICEGSEQIVEGPRYDGIVVHAHVQVNETDGISNT